MKRIRDEVEQELARRSGGRSHVLAAVTEAWPEAVGPAVARRAWPLRLGRDGTLHVAVSSSTWAYELDRLAGEILGRLTQRMGSAAPMALRFAVGPVPEPAGAPERSATSGSQRLEVPSEVESEAASAAAAIDDPELRELVERAARASISKARSGRPI